MNIQVPAEFHEGNASNCFVITMWIEKTGEAFVRSCEVIGKNFRNRTSFGERATIESAFSDRMAQTIKEALGKLSMRTEVLALPSLSVEMPELALARARIIATKLADGSINVIMRFKSFVGAINTAFREDVGFNTRLDTLNSAMATMVLEDIALPILNICTALKQRPAGPPGEFDAVEERLARKSQELGFQIELLKRFVMQQSQSSDASDQSSSNIRPLQITDRLL